jgi:hypothetical protein
VYIYKDLISYRYRPTRIKVDIKWGDIRAEMDFTGLYNKFWKEGIITYDCFSWIWEDKELANIVDESFDMYDYYT